MAEPVLPDDLHEREDAVELLAAATGAAVAAPDDEAFEELLDEVHPLIEAGMDTVARAIVEAALYRATHGRPTSREDFIGDELGEDRWDDLLRQGLDSEANSWLLAASLGAAADITRNSDNLTRAAELHDASARVWRSLGEVELQAFELLRRGATEHLLGNFKEALDIGDQASALFHEVGNTRGEVLVSLNLEQARQSMGDADGSLREFRNAERLALGLKDGYLSASISMARGVIEARARNFISAQRAFSRAYGTAYKRGEVPQAAAAARNLAAVNNDLGRRRRSDHWWLKSIDLATEIHDWRSAQDWAHQYALILADQGYFVEATSQLDRSAELNRSNGDYHQAARVQGDKVAVLLNWAIAESTPEDESRELIERSEALALPTWRSLEEYLDFEWATTLSHNLRAIWTLSRREDYGAEIFAGSAESHSAENPAYAGEVLHDAAFLLLAADRRDRGPAIGLLIRSAFLRHDEEISRAMDLASDAAYVATRDKRSALLVFDAALESLKSRGETAFGNIQNDAAIVAFELGDFAAAQARLEDVIQIASNTNNRVMLAKATGNLAELTFRDGDNARARELFDRAAELELKLGNIAAAADMQSAMSNAFIRENLYARATKASDSAQELAAKSGSQISIARALSTKASLYFADGDYELAYETWSRSAGLSVGSKSDEYRSFALEALARVGDWPRFKATFLKWAREAQKEKTQVSFVKDLHRPATELLRQNRAAPVGMIIAYAVLLGLEGVLLTTQGPSARTLPEADTNFELSRIAEPIGIAYAFFVLLDMPARQRATMRRAYERTIRATAPESARQILDLVDEYLASDLAADEGLET
jgi:hypothetical protein